MRFLVLVSLLTLVGCASSVVIDNEAVEPSTASTSYSIQNIYGKRGDTGTSLVLAFSGGGTRAAALAYGVLETLRDTQYLREGQTRRLLDDVKVISSVSGGSFTAAYYGLYGDKIFDDFKQRVLYQDLESKITNRLLSFGHMFSNNSRGDATVDIYREYIFGNNTFEHMRRQSAPLILINASDLSSGARISFVQEFFSLLCSDIDSFLIARAVAASAAVPLIFEPVVVQNFDSCDPRSSLSRLEGPDINSDDSQIQLALRSIRRLAIEKQTYEYLHLVDGGITDNLGLRSIYEMVELYGGITPFMRSMGRSSDTRSALIMVDASVEAGYGIGTVATEPGVEQAINAVTDIQLHRYNASTKSLMRDEFERWHTELSDSGNRVDSYFIDLSLARFSDQAQAAYLNSIPTRLSLTDEQVDALIHAGRELMRNSPEYQRLLQALGGTPQSKSYLN